MICHVEDCGKQARWTVSEENTILPCCEDHAKAAEIIGYDPRPMPIKQKLV